MERRKYRLLFRYYKIVMQLILNQNKFFILKLYSENKYRVIRDYFSSFLFFPDEENLINVCAIVCVDQCPGQNKNKNVVAGMQYLVSHGYANRIEHRYLVSGHSFLRCDQDFALVSKKVFFFPLKYFVLSFFLML